MRILVADDERVSRLALEALLQPFARTALVVAQDGASAAAALAADGPGLDLVCLDVRMPPPDGLALAAQIRASARWRRLPLLLITATAERATLQQAGALALQGFIVKPVNAETGERIARVLAQLDAAVLEPADAAAARLHVDAARHGRYVAALHQQLQVLQAQALALPAMPEAAAGAAFADRAEACRKAAATLGAPRIAECLADAIAAARGGPAGEAAGALAQGLYWFERVARARGLID